MLEDTNSLDGAKILFTHLNIKEAKSYCSETHLS